MTLTKLPESKLDVKLIALALDDTLLNKDCIITPKTVETLKKACKKGIYVLLCSGRAHNGIMPFVKQLDIKNEPYGKYMIAFNGSSIWDLQENREISRQSVPSEILKYVYSEAKKRGMCSIVYEPDTIYSWQDSSWARMDAELCNLKFDIKENFEEYLNNPFPKMLVPSEPEKVSSLKDFLCEKIGDKADIFISKPFFLEIMPKGVGKGKAILSLAEKLSIPKEKTMAFGDSMNDEQMIKMCGFGVAMQNALDYIKKQADFITEKDNNHDGISDFLEKYVL